MFLFPRQTDHGRVAAGRATALVLAVLLVGILVVAERIQAGGTNTGLGGVFRFRDHGTGVTAWGWPILIGFLTCAVLLVSNWVSGGANWNFYFVGAVLTRVVLLVAVVFMFVFTDLPQLEAKSLTWRTIVYPSLTLVVPVLYWWRVRPRTYPWFLDVNWTFVFTFDIVSNDLHWYGTWFYWDAFVHLTNSIPFFLSVACVTLALERRIRSRAAFGMTMFFSVLLFFAMHVVWETYEFLADEIAGTELQPGGMREATIDNFTGLTGALIGVGILAWWRRRGVLDARAVDPVEGALVA